MNGISASRGVVAVLVWGGLLVNPATTLKGQDVAPSWTSPLFQVEELSEGVWAVIAADSLSAISNAGIIDLGDATVVFDAFFSPIPAESLREAAETLTGRAVDYLVLGHWHDDHIRGAQSFSGATVVGSSRTRDLILTREPRNVAWQEQHVDEWVANEREQLRTTEGPQPEQRFWVDYYEAMAAALPVLETVAPTLTFNDRLVLHGSARTVELLEVGGGHTGSDVVLYVPDAATVFMGDLLFIKRHPYLGHGNPEVLVDIMERVFDMEPRHVVPGHGPVGNTRHLETMAQYVRAVEQHAAQLRGPWRTADGHGHR